MQRLYLELLRAASEARERAYAPNSGSCVGAAVLGESGAVYLGANFEFTRYADHGEQVAVHQALAAGESGVRALAVVVAPAAFHSPCGNCRQALFELNPELAVIGPGEREDLLVFRLADMLPHAYKRAWPSRGRSPEPCSSGDPLVCEALLARSRSLAHRSGYPEGAAVETSCGQVYRGAKIELSSYSSQAERMALASAFLDGHRKIERIALVGGTDASRPETPRNVNWDSIQALYNQNPRVRVVHPDGEGLFVEHSAPEFLQLMMSLS